MLTRSVLAFDRSARSIDVDGRMHIAVNRITKATVSPYYGREIPEGDRLGLAPDRVYQLLRHPDELQRAAESSNNIPLLDTHIVVSADEPQQQAVVGSTGTDAVYNHPYLENSLVIWTDWAIEGVETREQCELSCAYRYVVDLTPGTYEGLRYDGVMRNIQFNHVALVSEGRAGPDVVVGDTQLETVSMLTSRKALMVRGALATVLAPILAADKKIDLDAVLDGVNQANFKASKKTVLERLNKAIKGKLIAEDADLKPLALALDAMEKEECAEDEDDTEKKAEDEDEDDKKKAEDEESDDDKKKAEDEEDAPEKKPAMDEKTVRKMVAAAARTAETNTVKRMNDIADARALVKPFVGEVTGAMDSAEAVLKLALDANNIELDGTESLSALKTMVGMLAIPGAAERPKPKLATDKAAADAFATRFPDAKRLRRA